MKTGLEILVTQPQGRANSLVDVGCSEKRMVVAEKQQEMDPFLFEFMVCLVQPLNLETKGMMRKLNIWSR